MPRSSSRDPIETAHDAGSPSTQASPIGRVPLSWRDGATRIYLSATPEDKPFAEKLETHLAHLSRQGLIDLWHTGLLIAGTDEAAVAAQRLTEAEVVLLLVTANYLALNVTYAEAECAMAAIGSGKRVVPVIARPCDWRSTPFGELSPLPRDGRPVAALPDADTDAAYLDVASGIRTIVEELRLARKSPKARTRRPLSGRKPAASGAPATVPTRRPVEGRATGGTATQTEAVPEISTIPPSRVSKQSVVARTGDPEKDWSLLANLQFSLYGDHSCVAWSPEGDILASGEKDGTIVLWNADTGERCIEVGRHKGPVTGLAWSADGRLLASTAADKAARFWDARILARTRMNPVLAQQLATKFYDAAFRVRYARYARRISGPLTPMSPHERIPESVSLPATGMCAAWSPQEPDVAIGCSDGSFLILRGFPFVVAPRADMLQSVHRSITALAWGADRSSLLVAGDAGVSFWDVESRRARQTWMLHGGGPAVLARTSEGLTVYGGRDGKLLLYKNIESGVVERTIDHPTALAGAAFPARGHFAVSLCGRFDELLDARARATQPAAMYVWRSDTWELLLKFSHTKPPSRPPLLSMHPMDPRVITNLHAEESRVLNMWAFTDGGPQESLSRLFVFDQKMGRAALIELDDNGNEIGCSVGNNILNRNAMALAKGIIIGVWIMPLSGFAVVKLVELARAVGYVGEESTLALAEWAGINPDGADRAEGDPLPRIRLMAAIYRHCLSLRRSR